MAFRGQQGIKQLFQIDKKRERLEIERQKDREETENEERVRKEREIKEERDREEERVRNEREKEEKEREEERVRKEREERERDDMESQSLLHLGKGPKKKVKIWSSTIEGVGGQLEPHHTLIIRIIFF